MLQNNQNRSLNIPPIFAQNQFRLQTQKQAQTYTLQPLTGQGIKTGKLSGTETLDLSDLSTGVYLLEVQGDIPVRTKKVVVK